VRLRALNTDVNMGKKEMFFKLSGCKNSIFDKNFSAKYDFVVYNKNMQRHRMVFSQPV